MTGRSVAIGALVIPLMATLFLPSSARASATEASILFAAAVGLICAQLYRLQSPGDMRSSLFIPVLMGCAIMMSFLWRTPTADGRSNAILFVALLSCGAALSDLLSSLKGRRDLLRCLLASAVLLSLHALAQRTYLLEWLHDSAKELRPDLFTGEAQPFLESHRSRATFGQANGLGGFCALTLPLAIAWSRFTLARLWPALLIGAALLASASVGGMSAALIGIAFFLSCSHDRSHRVVGFSLLGAGALFLSVIALGILGWIHVDSLSRPIATAAMRIDYWRAASQALIESWPSGLGIGVYESTAENYATKGMGFSRLPHNGYLGWIVDMGALGLLMIPLLLAPVVCSLVSKKETTSRSHANGPSPFTCLAAALGLSILIGLQGRIALFFVPLDNTILHISLAALVPLGLLFVCSRRLKENNWSEHDDLRVGHAARAGLLALCVHASIDIDFHVSGLTAAAALTWALMGRHPTQKGGRNEPLLLTVIATALLLWGAFACLAPGG